MNSLQDLKLNELIAVPPSDVLLRWQPELTGLEMPLGQELYASGDTPQHVYFPTTAIVSLLLFSENGSTSEIAVVGKEGLVGVSIFMGGGVHPIGRRQQASRMEAPLTRIRDVACGCLMSTSFRSIRFAE